MSTAAARAARRASLVLWLALMISIGSWPWIPSAPGTAPSLAALLPLLLPLAGILRGKRRTLSWAPLAIAPALAITLTELLVDPAARAVIGVTLVLVLAAFAAVIAALRAAP